ncbi:MAG TPA: hypothetical protein VFK85_16785, partial [Anaeromyxobacteraceae bacterium]|nr:hypothetical protein [Anaeromyxobacteraceae bacterium]
MALAAALLAFAVPVAAAPAEHAPFSGWLQGVAGSAQALADGESGRAAALARDALATLPQGPATQRAKVALGLALTRAGEGEQGAKLVQAGANAIDPRIVGDVLAASTAAPAAPAAPPAPPPAAPPSTPDDRLREAERLVIDARPRDAVALLDEAGAAELSPEQRDRSALLRAWAYLQIGRRAEAESLARGILARPATGAGTRLGAEVVIARVAARAGRFADAIARYDLISTRAPAAIPGLAPATAREIASEAAYLSAWLTFDAGQWARAAEDLSRFAASHPRSQRALDARWFAAWALFRDGRAAEARAAWARLERTALAPAALYWQARVSPAARARPLYRKAIEAEPGGWYAFLAAGRLRSLGAPASALPRGAAAAVLDEPPAAVEPMVRATALLELGLRDAAIAQLAAATSGAPGR